VAVTAGRPLRADARRNRDSILETAVRVFAEQGLDANLDGIARQAGVGSATLYRNFPTREALIEAAYRNELGHLRESAPALLAEHPPLEALREWMTRFLDYATAKLGMADALRAVIESGRNPYSDTRRMMLEAIGALLGACREAGVIAGDIDPSDILAGVTGVALASGNPDQREQAGRLLDLLVAGLRSTKA
jgi:AcrR family transcriptional regulator